MADSSADSRTHASLLVRIRDPQDSEAWRIFAGVYTPIVYGYCRRRGLQEADSADVTQEVLACVLRSIKGFEYDPGRGRFRDWLGTTARNELARFMRKNERFKAGTVPAHELAMLESSDPDPDWIDQFHAHVLETALERIRPEFEPLTWRAFALVWLDGVNAAQAACDLHEPIEKIYVSKSRILKRLREEITSLAEDMPILALRGRHG